MKEILLTCFFLSLLLSPIWGQSELRGKVTEADSNEAVILGNVALYQNGVIVTGVETDFDGNYCIKNIEPGVYDVEASYVGFIPQRVVGVVVADNKVNILDIAMNTSSISMCICGYSGYIVPLYEQDNMTSGYIYHGGQLRGRNY